MDHAARQGIVAMLGLEADLGPQQIHVLGG